MEAESYIKIFARFGLTQKSPLLPKYFAKIWERRALAQIFSEGGVKSAAWSSAVSTTSKCDLSS